MNTHHDYKLATNPPIVATMTTDEAAALNASPVQDFRYVRVACITCGRVYQSIDFGCAQHRSVCANPVMNH